MASHAQHISHGQRTEQFSDEEDTRCCSLFRRRKPRNGSPQHSQAEDYVIVVDAHIYNEIVLDDLRDVLVAYYTDECGYCRDLAPVYDEVGKLYADHSDRIAIARCDIRRNTVPESIDWVPTIILYPAGKKKYCSVEYDGDTSVKGLVEFLKEYGTHKIET